MQLLELVRVDRRLLRRAALLLLAIWVGATVTSYIVGAQTIKPHNVETAVVWLAVAVLATRITSSTPASDQDAQLVSSTRTNRPLAYWTLPLWIVLSIVLYWPTLHIGLLSDDYVLLKRAEELNFSGVSPQLFRPTVMILWAAWFPIIGATGLHTFNAVAHGTNTWLTTFLAKRLRYGTAEATLAGILFLASPLAPEAVAWTAGAFDLLATALTLGGILLFLGYGDHAQAWRRCLFVAVALLGIGSKEWAVVAPALSIIAAAGVQRRCTRQQLIDAALVLFLGGAFAAWRLAQPAADLMDARIGQYFLKELAFRPFANLAFPWHTMFISRFAWLARAGTLLIAGWLLLWSVSERRDWRVTKLVAFGLAMVFLTVFPVFSYFFVSPQLEGARYLYAASTGWVLFLAATIIERPALRAFAVVLACLSTLAVQVHLQPWLAAARARDQVEQSVSRQATRRSCSSISISGLPDNVDGAYVFRNGAAEAFERDLGISLAPEQNVPERCRLTWPTIR